MLLSLLSLFVFHVKNADARSLSNDDRLFLQVRTSPLFVIPDSFEDQIRKLLIPKMQRCLDSSFKAAVDGLFPQKLELLNLEQLSHAENNGISQDPENTPHKIGLAINNGQLGHQTHTFEIIVSENVSVTHVTIFWSKEWLEFLDSEDMKRLNELIAEYEKVWTSSPQDPKLKEIEKEGFLISAKMPVPQKTNRIYINSNVFLQNMSHVSDESFSTPNILAHELMHAWGDLNDEYEAAKSNNLMTDFQCVLRKDQVQHALQSRGGKR